MKRSLILLVISPRPAGAGGAVGGGEGNNAGRSGSSNHLPYPRRLQPH